MFDALINAHEDNNEIVAFIAGIKAEKCKPKFYY